MRANPVMRLIPTSERLLAIDGLYEFNLTNRQAGCLTGNYRLRIEFSDLYPRVVPRVLEVEGKIPRQPDFHVNGDGSFCLGSPIRLKAALHENPDFLCFVEAHLDPYLYAVTHKLRHGGPFLFGELAHEDEGEIADYCELFGLSNRTSVLHALTALSTKKRIANKQPCPCGCGRRLGVCLFHNKLNHFRRCAPRCDFTERLSALA